MKTAEHLQWLKGNGHELGALTGTDHKALAAIDALFTLYAYTRKSTVLVAVRFTLAEMQASTRQLAKPLIARAMDWSDVEAVWDTINSDELVLSTSLKPDNDVSVSPVLKSMILKSMAGVR